MADKEQRYYQRNKLPQDTCVAQYFYQSSTPWLQVPYDLRQLLK
jgi:hypothetical protein